MSYSFIMKKCDSKYYHTLTQKTGCCYFLLQLSKDTIVTPFFVMESQGMHVNTPELLLRELLMKHNPVHLSRENVQSKDFSLSSSEQLLILINNNRVKSITAILLPPTLINGRRVFFVFIFVLWSVLLLHDWIISFSLSLLSIFFDSFFSSFSSWNHYALYYL